MYHRWSLKVYPESIATQYCHDCSGLITFADVGTHRKTDIEFKMNTINQRHSPTEI